VADSGGRTPFRPDTPRLVAATSGSAVSIEKVEVGAADSGG
jgi:hypothetical protein